MLLAHKSAFRQLKIKSSGKMLMPLSPTKLAILIVSNNSASLLKHHYHNITVTNKHDDVLALIGDIRFDLMLFDLDIYCSEFTARIKTAEGINNKTPIFAIASPDEISGKQYALPFEFDDWLIKPITTERLNEIIDRWQTKALDYIQTILGRTNNNPHLALTIFERLFEELPSQLDSIKSALADRQYGLAREITHRLNGSASFCGLINIQQSANTLECCLLNNDFITVEQHFRILEQHTLDLTRIPKLILTNLGNTDT